MANVVLKLLNTSVFRLELNGARFLVCLISGIELRADILSAKMSVN